VYTSLLWGHTSIIVHQNRLTGFRATGVRKSGTPIDLACRPYNSSALPCWLWFHCSWNGETLFCRTVQW